MNLLLLSLLVLLLSGAAAWVLSARPTAATRVGVGGAVVGGVLALLGALALLGGGDSPTLTWAWGLPGVAWRLGADPLSAFFLVPISILGALAALYGAEYLNTPALRPASGTCWFCYNLLVASMVLLVLARDAVLFLVAWETMALSSFFLVAYERSKPAVRNAAWTYLVATHLGTGFLLALFALLGRQAQSWDFAAFAVVQLPPALAGVGFLLAVVGFGTKAGFMPLHVWLPEAHPAAPSHVSALLSGVMIKMGIYGLLRVLPFTGGPAAWWGWWLVGIGATSGVLGVLFALAQHDLKRLLAYHSVENIGIIALGLGIGYLGLAYGLPALAIGGFAGALLHVLNHALFKGLLFLGAGAVVHATGTRELDHLGGLLKRLPWTGACFLVGAIAICGIPPLNGFISEFMIYFGAYHGALGSGVPVAAPALVTILSLALIGGLATACFTKAFGIVFLGEPRTEHGANAHEAGPLMRGAMAALAVGCLAIGLAAPLVPEALSGVLTAVTGIPPGDLAGLLRLVQRPLGAVLLGSVALLALILALAGLRAWLLRGRPVGRTVTWDCGYARPTARMQYTASSFAEPLVTLFAILLGTERRVHPPEGALPRGGRLHTVTPDRFHDDFSVPVFGALSRLLAPVLHLQHGRLHLYILYLALTLVALLLFTLA